jgi:hypothetical protein
VVSQLLGAGGAELGLDRPVCRSTRLDGRGGGQLLSMSRAPAHATRTSGGAESVLDSNDFVDPADR